MNGRPDRRRTIDAPRLLAFDALRAVHSQGAYANLVTAELLAQAGFEPRDAAFATELVSGTSRLEGTYDRVIEAASGRSLSTLQPAVVDVLRMACHQVLSMRTPMHAAVASSVDLAGVAINERVTGVVNAIVRKVGARAMDEWLDLLTVGMGERGALAVRGHHPRWIVDAFADVLPEAELAAALDANNVNPVPTLVVRPGLATVDELAGEPTRWSPYGAMRPGNPSDLSAIRQGRAGVQDEGSQLVALALARVDAPDLPWLDLCAGPGGKAALLAGLARDKGTWLLASESQEHRARLVAKALARYRTGYQVITADGTRPAWASATFGRVMADVPCTGLGALRRRPESRWRREASDLDELVPLQQALLRSAIESVAPGGVVAYVTCSPHRRESSEVVESVDGVEVLDAPSFLPEVPDAARGPYVQLWPHRHQTDAMFLALLRRV